LTGYLPGSVEIDGDSATATYGDPPEHLPPELATSAGAMIALESQDDRWLIASLPNP
jgi:hypothetical protein